MFSFSLVTQYENYSGIPFTWHLLFPLFIHKLCFSPKDNGNVDEKDDNGYCSSISACVPLKTACTGTNANFLKMKSPCCIYLLITCSCFLNVWMFPTVKSATFSSLYDYSLSLLSRPSPHLSYKSVFDVGEHTVADTAHLDWYCLWLMGVLWPIYHGISFPVIGPSLVP